MKKIKISFAELANKLKIDLDQPNSIDISSLGIEIESYDIINNKVLYKPMTHFIVKNPVEQYCILTSETKEQIKTTTVHRTWDNINKLWDSSLNKVALNQGVLVKEPMKVVDCTVQDTECYIANGFINHNTTPGGKALKFAASVRIKLMGKTPVRVLDPITQEIYDNAVEEWYNECEVWKENGGGKTGAKKPAKPKKTDFKGSEVTIGNDVTATLVKNKVGPPHREAEFRIIFTEGIIEEEAWFDYATKFKIIENENAFTYKFSEKSKIVFENELGPILFKRDEWLENVMVDVDIREQVKNQIVKMLTQSTKGAKAAPVKLGEEDEE